MHMCAAARSNSTNGSSNRSAARCPKEPAVWICGDCHVGNLGPVAAVDGRVDIQIRDLDQTVIGNPAHDIIRLALSLATASRGSDLPGVTTARILEQVIEGYQAALRQDADAIDDAPKSIQFVMKQSMARSWKHLANERLENTKPTIPLGSRFWALSKSERAAIEELFQTPPLHHLATSLKSRDDDASVEVADAAYWMKGCSSLGLLRFRRAAHDRIRQEARHGADGCQGSRHCGRAALRQTKDAEGSGRARRRRRDASVAASRQANGSPARSKGNPCLFANCCRRTSRSNSNA